MLIFIQPVLKYSTKTRCTSVDRCPEINLAGRIRMASFPLEYLEYVSNCAVNRMVDTMCAWARA